MSNLSEILNNSKYIDILNVAGKVGKDMGIKTYVVGGYIRDAILNRELKDIDIMVENNVFEFSSKLAKELKVKTIIKFEKFNTAKIPFQECEIEVANARSESYKKQSRKPKNVSPASIHNDLIRRDFSINALASSLHPDDFGDLIDLFEGVKNIHKGIINTPTDPDKTFIDDPLRMLRAIRFASQLNFEIHPRIKESITKNKERIV